MRGPNIAYSEHLDHLRFFAALMVISFHSFHSVYKEMTLAASSAAAPVNALSIFFIEGHTAVGLFLVLSGFLLARICMGNAIDVKQFYLNRLLRVYPLYVCAFVLSMCIVPAPFTAFVTSLLSFQTLSDALHSKYVDHLWSVGVEMQIYAIFPLLLFAYRKAGLRYLFLVILFSLLVLGFVQLSTGATRDVAYATILGRLNQAVIGMILAFSLDRLRKYMTSPLTLVASLIALSLALQAFHACGGLNGTGSSPLWILWLSLEALLWGLVICCYQACRITFPPFISRPLARLGAMSYSLYVTHYALTCALCAWFSKLVSSPRRWHESLLPVQSFLMAHPLESSLLVGTFVILPPTLLFSFFSFTVIEQPFMELRRRYLRGEHAQQMPETESEAKVSVILSVRG